MKVDGKYRRAIDDSKSNVREGKIGKFYGDTKLIVLPFTQRLSMTR